MCGCGRAVVGEDPEKGSYGHSRRRAFSLFEVERKNYQQETIAVG